jgi:serine/threonine protein kinase
VEQVNEKTAKKRVREMILEPGTLLNGRYRIVEVLGQGGMGSIYRASDENLDIDVAVKDNLFTTDEYARQFRREATILATLRHPSLPRVTDHFIIADQGQYLVMDYIEGEDLRQRMERVNTISEDEAVVIGAAICDALMYLGTREPQVIHRDIKPGNVKITPQGQIFLVDFGLAKTIQGSQATTTGARAMTPGFSPPEQYGTARTDMRTDIFSLGATLYAALTGVTPEDSLARAMNQAELTPIREHNPKVSKKVAAAVEKALELQPEDRFQTPEAFKQALLASGASTGQKNGSYHVAPPPLLAQHSADAVQNSKARVKKIPSKPNMLFASQEMHDDEYIERPRKRSNTRPKKRSRKIGCLILSSLFIVLAGFGAVLIRQDPGASAQLLNQIAPAAATFVPVQAATSNPIAEQSATPTHAPTQTSKILPTTAVAALVEPTLNFSTTPIPTHTLVPFRPSNTPTALPTSVGGGNGWIAYASNIHGIPQVLMIQSDGKNRQQITDIPEGACQPDFSPDGSRIIFTSPCDNNSDYYPGSSLYIINLDGSGLLPLPTMVGGDYDPSWSPDGKYIAFTSMRNANRPQVYLLNLEDNTVKALSEKFSLEMQPAWSPDGKKILYVLERNSKKDIWVMDADGSNKTQFTHTPSMLDSLPAWSPNGEEVLITQYVAVGGVPRVVIAPFNLLDYVEYQIGKEKRPMRDAIMSPDRYWIAYEGWNPGGLHNIYLITTTGISVHQLTDEQTMAFDPVWQPIQIPEK